MLAALAFASILPFDAAGSALMAIDNFGDSPLHGLTYVGGARWADSLIWTPAFTVGSALLCRFAMRVLRDRRHGLPCPRHIHPEPRMRTITGDPHDLHQC
ncbi:hypothetical protein THIX_60740 [Thiomonas sp. X19]|uniref:hypothetical protein n=1 Tax=Thiomonas sp. X19 TaxID=1050370 RepID=UPI000B729F45|nr:hypothetical protein [Thiomonas sp. X19]SCC94682.1 hypothetical protein THIX_60740 [Thiomonas sp. X19]